MGRRLKGSNRKLSQSEQKMFPENDGRLYHVAEDDALYEELHMANSR